MKKLFALVLALAIGLSCLSFPQWPMKNPPAS